MSSSMNFKIDTSSYLGQQYDGYKNELLGVALANPSKYFKIRKNVVDYVKKEAVKNLYDVIYYTLKEGKKTDGSKIDDELPEGPEVPPIEINEIALTASRTLNKILDEVLEKIVPVSYKDLAGQRLMMKGEANAL